MLTIKSILNGFPRFAPMLGLKAVVIVALCGFAIPANAFRYGGHFYIAQEVLNDARDGSITIDVGGSLQTYPVPTAVVNAINQNPDAFLLGAIGPGAFPDILAGQLLVHPGNVTGTGASWASHDWLRYLLDEAPASASATYKAFAYGYMTHAAADVWGHSYVNVWSGQIFDLGDGELEAERRHVGIERYVDAKLPAVWVSQKGQWSSPIALFPDMPGALAVEIADTTIFDSRATDQNDLNAATKHLSVASRLYSELDNLYQKLADVDALFKGASAPIGWVIDLTGKKSTLNILAGNVASAPQSGESSAASAFTAYVSSNLPSFAPSVKSQIDLVNLNASNLSTSLASLASAQSTQSVTEKIEVYVPKTCWKWGVPYTCFTWKSLSSVLGISVQAAQSYACNALPYILGLNGCRTTSAWDAITATITSLTTTITNTTTTITTTTVQITQTLNPAIQTQIANIMTTNGLIAIPSPADIAKFADPTQITDPIRRRIEEWRSDVHTAMREWIVTSTTVGKVASNVTTPVGLSSLMAPITQWSDCWGLVLAGAVNSVVSTANCKAQQRVESLFERIKAGVKQLDDLAGQILGARTPIQVVDDIMTTISTWKLHIQNHIVRLATGLDFKALFDMFSQPANSQSIDAEFAADDSGRSFLVFTDASARMKADMGIAGEGLLNSAAFRALKNAITLAKLALLDQTELNNLATNNGLTGNIYGPRLYNGDDSPKTLRSNILFESLRSMDGHHQWQAKGVPLPRRDAAYDSDYLGATQYGSCLTQKLGKTPFTATSSATQQPNLSGFRFYEDASARSKIFNRIFAGPLVPSIENPSEAGLSTIWFNQVFKACAKTPFPRTVSDSDHVTNSWLDYTCTY